MLFGPREIFTFIYMILLMGINLAVKLYIGTQRERRRVAELEKEMLDQIRQRNGNLNITCSRSASLREDL